MPPETMSLRALNRALLARQLLLERKTATPLRVVEALAGMQAQLARPPYVGMWSRVPAFRRETLTAAITKRQIVRATMMRGTIHVVSARDFVAFRATLQPMLSTGMKSVLGDKVKALDLDAVIAAARELFHSGSRTFDTLRGELATRFPQIDERAMGYAVRTHLPLVMVPDGGAWGFPGKPEFADAEAWLGKLTGVKQHAATLMVRYLGAFGPATVADAQEWSGMSGLAAVFDALRPQLAVFRDERQRELFDVPRAPRPEGSVEAPVRFLPDYDNILLAHADRRRIIADVNRKAIATANLRVLATFLIDGFVAGTWRVETKRKTATLVLTPFAPLTQTAREIVAAEGEGLLAFLEPDAVSRELRFA